MAGTLRLLVWRKSPEGTNKYTLVGSNRVTVTDNYRQAAIFLSNSSGGYITVQKGDMLGWGHEGPGVLEYDARPDAQKLVRFIYSNSRSVSVRASMCLWER